MNDESCHGDRSRVYRKTRINETKKRRVDIWQYQASTSELFEIISPEI